MRLNRKVSISLSWMEWMNASKKQMIFWKVRLPEEASNKEGDRGHEGDHLNQSQMGARPRHNQFCSKTETATENFISLAKTTETKTQVIELKIRWAILFTSSRPTSL